MYRSANRYRQRLPATRFWEEYAPAHQLKAVGSDEVLMDALASAVIGPAPHARMEQFSDYEVAGLAVDLARMGLIRGVMPEKFVEAVDRRLEREEADIHFSDEHRLFLHRLILAAAAKWKKS